MRQAEKAEKRSLSTAGDGVRITFVWHLVRECVTMFQTCRQLSRLTSHHNAVVKIISVNNDSLSPGKVRAYSGKGADDGQDGRPNYSRSFCPFVLAKSLTDYVGLIGAGFIVGLKLQCELCRLKHLSRSSNDSARTARPIPQSLSQKVLTVRDRYLHFPIFPLFVLRASPVLNHVGQKSLNSSAVHQLHHSRSSTPSESDSQSSDRIDKKLISGRTLNQYRQELMSLSKNYTADLMNKIGVGLIESRKGNEGMQCLKANATCAKALYNLAVAYETGRYSEQSSEPDLKLAFEYYDRAARLNHKFATYNLALFYLYGKGHIERDSATGGVLMRKAFDLGVDRAAAFKNFRQIEEPRKVEAYIPPPAAVSEVRTWRLLSRLMSSSRDVHEQGTNKADAAGTNAARMAICY